MTRDEIRKLLGGYATGTLTDEERRALFEAALEDQELFDALADEEALRELLSDERYRRELAAALGEKKPGFGERLLGWWRRPLPAAIGAAAAVGAIAIGLVVATRPTAQQVAMRTEQAPEMSEPAAPVGAVRKQERPAIPVQESPAAVPAEALADKAGAAAEEKGPSAAGAKTKAAPARRKAEAAMPEAVPPEREMAVAEGAAPEVGPVTAMGEAKGRPGFAGGLSAGRAGVAPGRATRLAAPATLGSRALEGEQLRVAVERRVEGGEFEPVAAGYRFRLDETVRLRVASPVSGFLYVAEQTDGGGWRLIYSGPVEAGRPATVPPTGGLVPPAGPGVRKLRVIVSREAVPLERLETGEVFEPGAAEHWAEIRLEYRAGE